MLGTEVNSEWSTVPNMVGPSSLVLSYFPESWVEITRTLIIWPTPQIEHNC